MPAPDRLMAAYPQIYFACHTRHVQDTRGRTISAHQASILDHLDETEPTTMTELARHMGVSLSTMSLTVDRLVAGGYVVRTRDLADGRRVSLRLTELGVETRERKSVLDPRLVELLLGALPEEEREQALTGLEILAKAAAELIQTAAFKNAVRIA